jgi:hypothetical protein
MSPAPSNLTLWAGSLTVWAGIAVMGCAASATASRAAPPGTRLDLRLPVKPALLGRSMLPFGTFPSAASPPRSGANGHETTLPDLPYERGGDAVEFARRFHREGLPVARLWESRTAFVSLGLNARGKPGLWLVQKIH